MFFLLITWRPSQTPTRISPIPSAKPTASDSNPPRMSFVSDVAVSDGSIRTSRISFIDRGSVTRRGRTCASRVCATFTADTPTRGPRTASPQLAVSGEHGAIGPDNGNGGSSERPATRRATCAADSKGPFGDSNNIAVMLRFLSLALSRTGV
ncbi:unnamed protein product, partial [Mycena citricolor]